jgi:hypothetical protein
MTDHIVLRHGPDIPHEHWAQHLEGVWLDVDNRGRVAAIRTPAAVAEPTLQFEYRDDGAVAQVYEIRLTIPNETRG